MPEEEKVKPSEKLVDIDTSGPETEPAPPVRIRLRLLQRQPRRPSFKTRAGIHAPGTSIANILMNQKTGGQRGGAFQTGFAMMPSLIRVEPMPRQPIFRKPE